MNADKKLPPASVTKIMTLLLVMEAIEQGSLKLNDVLTCSSNAASMGGSQVYLKEGDNNEKNGCPKLWRYCCSLKPKLHIFCR